MISQDIKLYRGDDFTLEIAILNDNGTPADLVGADIKLGFSDGVGDVSYANISVNNNVVQAHFAHATTKELEYSRGEWDLQITKNNIVTTVARGKLIITRDITP